MKRLMLPARDHGNRLWLWALLLWLLAACQPQLLNPPRLATEAARQAELPAGPALPATPTPPPATPSPTPSSPPIPMVEAGNLPTLTFWVNETSTEHMQALAQMAREFNARYQIDLEIIHVSPGLLPELMATAAVSGTLPDLVLHPIDFSMGWYERGWLDGQAAADVLHTLGRDTFQPTALAWFTPPDRPQALAALPSDSWPQLLIYRADWFAQAGLDPPDSYDRLLAAAEALSDPEALISGLVIPTESSLISSQYAFEQMAVANGCELVDQKGEIIFIHPACLDALDFYRSLVNQYSPIGVQTDASALNAYLSGRTGIIIASPAILPSLAGLDAQHKPACAECNTVDFLARNSGFLTTISGRGEFAAPASFTQVTALGITSAADRTAAEAFATFWFEDGYSQWLAIEPERKVPLRLGTASAPDRFRQEWARLPLGGTAMTLGQLFDPSLPEALVPRFAGRDRWGFAQGQGPLMTRLSEELTLSLLLQEMLSGYFSSSQTVIEAYNRVVELIPGYAYTAEPEATATP